MPNRLPPAGNSVMAFVDDDEFERQLLAWPKAPVDCEHQGQLHRHSRRKTGGRESVRNTDLHHRCGLWRSDRCSLYDG